jgi:hypothetical protein
MIVVLLSVHRPCCCNPVPYLLIHVVCFISNPPWQSRDLEGQSTSNQERRQSSRNSGFSLLLLSDKFLFQLMFGQGCILCDISTAFGSYRWCCVKCFANRFIVPVVLWFVLWSVWLFWNMNLLLKRLWSLFCLHWQNWWRPEFRLDCCFGAATKCLLCHNYCVLLFSYFFYELMNLIAFISICILCCKFSVSVWLFSFAYSLSGGSHLPGGLTN